MPGPGTHRPTDLRRIGRRSEPVSRFHVARHRAAASGGGRADRRRRCPGREPTPRRSPQMRRQMLFTIIKLVAFFAVCALFTAYLAFTIGNIHLFQHTYKLTGTFDDATGLLPDDNVKVAGVVVGKVGSIKIDQGKAKVQFTVKDSVKVPTDSSVAIRWRNLIGQRYLSVYAGNGSTVLKGGDTVAKTRSVVDVGELFNRLGPIVKAIDPKDVNTFLDTIVQALDGNTEK